jgi:hypothetical protein
VRRMLRSQLLRHRLIELVLVAAPLAACEGGRSQMDAPEVFDPCQVPQQLVKVVPEPPPAGLLALVRSCEASAKGCDDLCRRILADEGLGSNDLKSCAVNHTAVDHTVTVGYCFLAVEGRRPHGLASARTRCSTLAGGHLARAAFYEAASVHAFVQLARELRRHRAPRALVSAVRRSAAQEIIHARVMTELSRARGSVPPPVVVSAPRRRSIEAIAIENAREGLVGETWSAMTVVWQSMHAPDERLRATYARIAADELRHAEVAVEIDRWTRERLTPAARARVDSARDAAIRALARQVRVAPKPALVSELGLPDRAAAARMFDAARGEIWS